jgi:hypothetical protein
VSTELASPPSTVRRLARRPFARAVALYIALRLATVALVAVANLFTHHGLVNDLAIWDGAWFMRAVRDGWPSHLPMFHGVVLANPIAFFPLFPLLLRALTFVTGLSAQVVGLWVSALTGLSALLAVGFLTREYTDQARAERAALVFALIPGGFAFNLIYNEGLFVTLVALGLLALLRRRWLVAGLLGLLASATSPVGLVLAFTCAVSSLRAVATRREWRSLVAPLLAPLGFLTWLAYLWAHTGTWRAWQLTERDGWNSYPSLVYPFQILGKFITNPLSPTMTGQILFWGTVAAIGLLVVAYRERPPLEILTYVTAAVVLFSISNPVGLRPRFLLLAFPLFTVAATRWRGWRFIALIVVCAASLALMTYESLTSFAVFP